MSSESTPSRSEVQTWDACSLADYMKRLKLSGCDKMVKKYNITGERFLKMTRNDLKKFPITHIPVISRLCGEINRTEDRRGFGHRSEETKSQPQDFTQQEVWRSNEFHPPLPHRHLPPTPSDDVDYEEPVEQMENNYVCARSEQPGTGKGGEEESEDEEDYERVQDSGVLCHVKPQGYDSYVEIVCEGSSAASTAAGGPRPPQRPVAPAANCNPARPPLARADPSDQRAFNTAAKPPTGPAVTPVDRSKKPAQTGHPRTDPPLPKGSPFSESHPPMGKPYQLKGPKPPDIGPRPGRPTPSLLPSLPMLPTAQPKPSTDMDPRWYGGQMTRQQGEMSLRRINKDGAFLVRDSSKGLFGQPYTLMVLCLGKVYNLQIRLENSTYTLGTGLMNTQSFPTVREIIAHHEQTPLLLINAKDPDAQRHCCLTAPGREERVSVC